MIDESRARGLQSMYQAGAVGALSPLYEECTGIAYMIALKKARGMNGDGGVFTHDKLVEIAGSAAIELVKRYLSDSDFHVRRFTKFLDYRVRDAMFTPLKYTQQTFEDKVEYRLEIDGFETFKPNESFHDPYLTHFEISFGTDPLLEIVCSHPKGKKIAADLCRSRSYRQAIRRIAVYVERRWIYEHAEALHEVYRTLHSKTQDRGISRGGLSAVRKRLLQGKRYQREQADKRSSEGVMEEPTR